MDFLQCLTTDTQVVLTACHYSTLQGELEKHRNATLEGNETHYGALNGKVISSPSFDPRKSIKLQLVCVKALQH
ncbi:hypothetical protein NC652_000664 [Populus alba x Populus x berolinensis]|nr:hypothetical protein NC652_000664 [Populus alba x Populus x berolinensis]